MGERIVRYANRTRYWQVYAFNNPPEGYQYKKGLLFPSHKIGIKKDYIRNTKFFAPFEQTDLYHTYNGIVVNNKPWVVEVEDQIPRYGKYLNAQSTVWQFGFDKLKSRWCKKLIYTSQYSKNHFSGQLIENGLDPTKIAVVYRAVEQFDKIERNDDTLRILFVSTTFFGKGGAELLKAFTSLPYKDIHLTIVSNFSVDWGVYPTKEEEAWAKKTIADDPRITHIEYLSHDKVIEQMRHADLFVAVSYADTFNNTTLEAMGCGLPVITSEIRAFPEIVEHEQNGFIIPTIDRSKEAIAEEIKQKIDSFYTDKSQIKKMGNHSCAIVEKKFTIQKRQEQLRRIYDEALDT